MQCTGITVMNIAGAISLAPNSNPTFNNFLTSIQSITGNQIFSFGSDENGDFIL